MKRAIAARFTSVAPSKRVLLVWHSRTGFAEQMADALEAGALDAAEQMGGGLSLARRRAADATVEDVLRSDAYLFCGPENLASASGEMLEFFHRSYYHAFAAEGGGGGAEEVSRLLGRPYGLAVAAGSDGTGAARQLERICRGWRLRPVADTVICQNGQPQTAAAILSPKACPAAARARCAELGGLLAATALL